MKPATSVTIDESLRNCFSDNYAAEFSRSQFRQHGISLVPSEFNRSQLYLEALPLFTSGNAVLLDDNRLISHLGANGWAINLIKGPGELII